MSYHEGAPQQCISAVPTAAKGTLSGRRGVVLGFLEPLRVEVFQAYDRKDDRSGAREPHARERSRIACGPDLPGLGVAA
jgi:hypothetical protein